MSDDSIDDSGGWRESLSGIRDVFRSGADNASAYLKARTELVKIEAEEAAAAGKSIGFLCGTGSALLVVGYSFLVLVAVFYFTESLSNIVNVTLGALGVVHSIVGAIVLNKGRRRQRETRWFAESLEQWKRDQEWIEKTLKRSNREKPSS